MILSNAKYLWAISIGFMLISVKATAMTLYKHKNEEDLKNIINPLLILPSDSEIETYGLELIEQELNG